MIKPLIYGTIIAFFVFQTASVPAFHAQAGIPTQVTAAH